MAATESVRELVPESYADAAELLREAAGRGGVRVRGGGTKLGWGQPSGGPGAELSTRRLDRVVEHNQGDFTVIVQAGVRFERLQSRLRDAGQRVSLDPPTGPDGEATIGGIVAAADSGPLRHRYGTPRDLVLGVTVALPDGTLGKSGGRVIKNVAGYDLGKLYAGSFGTLGTILQVALRLHPLPAATATMIGRGDDPRLLADAALRLARAPLEPEALDVRWDGDQGAVLVRLTGQAAERLAERAEATVAEAGLETEVTDDAAAWDEQRGRQRARDGAIVRVSATATRLAEVIEAARAIDAPLVGRAAVGTAWIALQGADDDDELVAAIAGLRRRLAPSGCVVLDAPESVRARLDVWAIESPGERRLMAAIKHRFDPGDACNPGLFGAGAG